MTYEINPVGDVKEAVHRPTTARLASQGSVARAGHAEAGPSSYPQQIEVRIARRQLPLNLLHVRIEALHRIARIVRADLSLAGHVRNDQSPIPTRQQSGPVQLQLQ